MAFPKSDRKYALITNSATSTAESPGSLEAILMQIDSDGKFYAISFASHQLKDHENNYSPFLLNAAMAVWGMDVFNEYLHGKQLILYRGHKPLENLSHLHNKILKRLQTASNGINGAWLHHSNKKGLNMPAETTSRDFWQQIITFWPSIHSN
jgi:hypothetical protein